MKYLNFSPRDLSNIVESFTPSSSAAPMQPTKSAEREIRPAVLMHKTVYDNRSPQGSRNQEILITGVRTCANRGINFVETIAEDLACS